MTPSEYRQAALSRLTEAMQRKTNWDHQEQLRMEKAAKDEQARLEAQIKDQQPKLWEKMATSGLMGAGSGAAIGTAVPVIGTAVGAVAGAAVGAGLGAFSKNPMQMGAALGSAGTTIAGALNQNKASIQSAEQNKQYMEILKQNAANNARFMGSLGFSAPPIAAPVQMSPVPDTRGLSTVVPIGKDMQAPVVDQWNTDLVNDPYGLYTAGPPLSLTQPPFGFRKGR